MREGAELDDRSLDRYLAERLSREKRPRRIEVVDALPKSAAGKLERQLLRERYAPATSLG
jgi:acyl-CoA synthetase (AMP-forming)/AMP-acid ligase II